MTDQAVALFDIQNEIGWVTLNRPKALNALSYDMCVVIGEQLKEWRNDDLVKLICIQGAGEKGFCAGGDVRSLYDHKEQADVVEFAHAYLSAEYKMDYMVHAHPKPVLVYMDGIVMGGGVGLSIGAKVRIVTEKTKWAMPEMNIGFFPDVGSSYSLNRMQGYIGRYLALTSDIIQPADVLYIHAADKFLESRLWPEVEQALRTESWADIATITSQLNQLVDRFCTACPGTSKLRQNQAKIDQHFSQPTVERIAASLREAEKNGDEWAAATLAMLLRNPPTSMKVALEELNRGKNLSLESCFSMEANIGAEFMKHPDFFEGVRSVLVDKDRNPRWSPKTLEEVASEQIAAYFSGEF